MTIPRMMSGCSRCRNKAIAEAFAYMRVAEKWGLGIPNAMHAFAEYGLQAPEYTDWGNAVKVTVRRIPKKLDTGPEKGDVALNEAVEPNISGERTGVLAVRMSGSNAGRFERYSARRGLGTADSDATGGFPGIRTWWCRGRGRSWRCGRGG